MENFSAHPVHYENQFEIAPGTYNLKVAFSTGGQNFGKLEMPLQVDAYHPGDFALSGLALSKEAVRVSDLGASLDASLLEDKTPMISNGVQMVPSGSSAFKKMDLTAFYFEIYEPLLVNPDPKNPPAVAIEMKVLDRKSGEQKADTGLLRIDLPSSGSSPVIPVAEKMPVAQLGPGAYVLELIAEDSANRGATRNINFEIEP